jgi:hypothetical protein
VKQQPLDKKWLVSGELIGTGAKAYGFRVDNVLNHCYRMLGGL